MIRQSILLLAAPLLLAGCEAQQLYVTSQTVIGINASLNEARTAGKLVIGYDRDFAVIIPKSVDRVLIAEEPTVDGTKKNVAIQYRDAMSAMSCTEMEVNGIFMTRFTESMATGYAARNFAGQLAKTGNEQKAREFFACFESGKGTAKQ